MTHQNQRNEQPDLISKEFTTFTNGNLVPSQTISQHLPLEIYDLAWNRNTRGTGLNRLIGSKSFPLDFSNYNTDWMLSYDFN